MSARGTAHHQETTYYSSDTDTDRQAARAARLHARDVEYRAALRIPPHVRLPKALGLTNHAHGDNELSREILGSGVRARFHTPE